MTEELSEDVFIEMIKEAEPDMSRQLKSHYKKQFIKMREDEIKQNLVYKLCLKIWEMERDEIRSYKGDIKRKDEIIKELKDNEKHYKITINSLKQKLEKI